MGGIAKRVLHALVRWSGLALLVRETLQRRRMTMVFYHEVDPKTLDRHLAALQGRYNFIALRDYVRACRSGRRDALPPKPLVVTLDDGNKTDYELLEVFRRYSVTPTVFLCSGIAGTHRRYWWTVPGDVDELERLKRVPDEDRMEALARLGFEQTESFPERCALSLAEIEEMREVVDFQAHTVFHPILTRCSAERSWQEISRSRQDLRDGFGFDVYAIAYPNGSYSDREVEYVSRAGYECAITTRIGFNSMDADLFRLKRTHMPNVPSATAAIARACVVPALARQWVLREGALS